MTERFSASTSILSARLAARLLCSTAILFLPNLATANPVGGQVTVGTATISQPSASSTTVTQQTEKAIINWQSFSIGQGQTTTFKQPDTKAVTLNRVTGIDPSKIAGSLTANGQVWLINPNGVAFSRSARVNVGGLLATTIDISDQDFMSGNYRFTSLRNPSAMVTNAGHITIHDAGLAALVAPGVENSGVIEAELGQIQLSSAAAFTVDLYGDGLFNFTLDKQVTQAIKRQDGTVPIAAVSNSGKLIANGGKILLTANAASSVVNHAIDMTGYAEATSANVAQNGDIVLDGGAQGTVAVAGTLDASGKAKGQTGGTVEVTGQNVQLASSAKVDASGDAGGGTVHIGGDEHGAGPLRNAATTSVAQGATVNVDAVTSGSGGNVTVWSDTQTDYQGTISARGGATDGNGGAAEVSSHGVLNYSGTVDLRAPNGTTGNLLLDPENVTIAANGDEPTLPSSPSGPIDLTANQDNSVLAVSTLQSALALADVTVSTGSTGSQAGDITVATNIAWSNENSLTLSAYRNIIVNDGVTISNTGAGNLNLNADNTGTGVGTVTFNGTGKVDFSGSTGLVSIFYNPSDNPAGSGINAVSYTSPTDYSPYVLANAAVPGQLTAYMLVNTAYDLQNIENNVSGDYALGRNIDASGTASWNGNTGFMPIDFGFTGILDGQNYSISNLTINGTLQDVGIFVGIAQSGVIQSLKITAPTFYGTYTGNLASTHAVLAGHNDGTLRNITLDSSPAALTGINSGTISDVTVANLSLTASTPAGSSGNSGGITGTNESGGTITNSSVTGLITITGNSQTHVGGLVGYNYGTISNSWTSITATSNGSASGSSGYLGGLVGYNDTSGIIELSHASGSVYGNTICDCGGLVGDNAGVISQSYADNTVGGDNGVDLGGLVSWNTGTITQSYATGAVTAGSNGYNRAGGLVAFESSSGSIDQSYATGAVSGGAWAIGGLAGDAEGSISQSYATGHLQFTNGQVPSNLFTPGPQIGGLIGYVSATPTVTDSYWDTQTTGASTSVGGTGGQAISIGATGLTSAQLKSGLPAGFDPAVWTIDASENSGYPFLQWQNGGSGGGSGPGAPIVVYFGAFTPGVVTWSVADATSTYGTLAALGGATLYGVSAPDSGNVEGTVGLFSNQNLTNPVTLTASLSAGTYYEAVTALTGSAAGNYTLSSTGDVLGVLTIDPKLLTWAVSGTTSTYGTLATLGNYTLNGVLPGDVGNVNGTVGVSKNGTLITLTAKTDAGQYVELVTGLTGTAAGNYTLATTGNTTGMLTINMKALTWSIANATAAFGTLPVIPEPVLSGVLIGDTVYGTPGIFSGTTQETLSTTLPVGSYTEDVTGLTGGSAKNYTLASAGNDPGTLTIYAPSAITSATAQTSSFDAQPAWLTNGAASSYYFGANLIQPSLLLNPTSVQTPTQRTDLFGSLSQQPYTNTLATDIKNSQQSIAEDLKDIAVIFGAGATGALAAGPEAGYGAAEVASKLIEIKNAVNSLNEIAQGQVARGTTSLAISGMEHGFLYGTGIGELIPGTAPVLDIATQSSMIAAYVSGGALVAAEEGIGNVLGTALYNSGAYTALANFFDGI